METFRRIQRMKEYKAGKIFSGSEALAKILEEHGFVLYDAEHPFDWKQAQKDGPRTRFFIGDEYLVVRKPARGQTPKEAFAETAGIGPALIIEDPKNTRWLNHAASGMSPRTVVFTRLTFYPNALSVRTRPTVYQAGLVDQVAMAYELAVDTFKKFFTALTSKEVGELGVTVVRDEALERQ